MATRQELPQTEDYFDLPQPVADSFGPYEQYSITDAEHAAEEVAFCFKIGGAREVKLTPSEEMRGLYDVLYLKSNRDQPAVTNVHAEGFFGIEELSDKVKDLLEKEKPSEVRIIPLQMHEINICGIYYS
ncbi:hypothetical protein JW826_00195 [Candidatus Woesearchaeota archaeon]|nr:hypothetical protein [Candidatus Woesearchaeota archaeon]